MNRCDWCGLSFMIDQARKYEVSLTTVEARCRLIVHWRDDTEVEFWAHPGECFSRLYDELHRQLIYTVDPGLNPLGPPLPRNQAVLPHSVWERLYPAEVKA